jgi:O-antigen ligase
VRRRIFGLSLGNAAIGLASGLVAGAAAVVNDATLRAIALGIAVSICLVSLSTRRLERLLVGATYVTRFRATLVGVRVLPEQLLVPVVLVAGLLQGRRGPLLSALRDRTVRLLGLFVLWSAFVSVLRSSDVTASLNIVAWLGMSWLILVSLVAFGETSERLQRQIIGWGVCAAVIAVVLFAIPLVLSVMNRAGLTTLTFGTQIGTALGAPAASHGLAFEANILGSTMAIAGFLCIVASRSVISSRARILSLIPILLAMILSNTRGAALAFIAGLMLWGLRPSARILGRLIATLMLVLVLLLSLSALAPDTANTILSKVDNLTQFSSGTGLYRLDSWRTAVGDLSVDSAVTGLGTNSFGQRHLEPTLPTKPTPAYLGNALLQIVYDTGIVGMFIWVAALLTVWPRALAKRPKARGLLLIFLISSAATSTLWFGSTWALIALAVLSRRNDEIQVNGSRTTASVTTW